MNGFHRNFDGERHNPDAAAPEAAVFHEAAVLSQQQMLPQRYPETYRDDEQQRFEYDSPAGVSSQTLEGDFAALSIRDSTARQNPLLNTQRRSQALPVQTQGMNDSWFICPSNVQLEMEFEQINQLQNNSVNGSNWYAGNVQSNRVRAPPDHMLNNSFLNGNLGHVPYVSRNPPFDQWPLYSTNGLRGGINGSQRRTGGFQTMPRTSEMMNKSIVLNATNPITSPLLQNMIEGGSMPQIDMIFNEIIPHICDLMVDPCGHLVIKKLMTKCNLEQINMVLDMVIEQPLITARICADSLGTRSFQFLLECLQSEDQISRIVEALSLDLLQLARNNVAKYVILECFNRFSPSQNTRLLQAITENCNQIAIDQHGCCMLQHSLSMNIPELTQFLLSQLIPNALNLSVNRYGNYVVQYLMELEDEHIKYDLTRVLTGSYVFLAHNKYGSHTVQKLLRVNNLDITTVIVLELLNDINTLICDPFGNYVIQTAWEVCQENMRMAIQYYIRTNIPLIRCNKYGRKVLDKIRS